MKRASHIFLVAVVILLAIALTKSITTMVSLTNTVSAGFSAGESKSLHVSVFLPEQATSFFQNIRWGVQSAADNYDLAVSFHPIGPGAPEFRLAEYTGIDGAIVYPYLSEPEMIQQLRDFSQAGVPVVLVEQDVGGELPWTFVGTNNFEMGRRIGLQLLEREDHEQIVVVYSDKSPAVAAEKELIELGITTVMGERLRVPIARRHTDLNPLDAEAVTYQLLRSPSSVPVTALVFTDTDDTLAALQTIINLNLVGEVQVIGFGITDAITAYLDRGVLDATIAVNPERIGIESVRVLSELIQTGNAPGYLDTGVETVKGAHR